MVLREQGEGIGGMFKKRESGNLVVTVPISAAAKMCGRFDD